MWLLTVMVVLMNIPVFVVTPRLKDTSEATKITMISLAVTDITLGIEYTLRLCYFTARGRFYFEEDYLCHIDGLVQAMLGAISINTIVYLCIDRVITIKYPLYYPIYFTKKVVISIQIGIWLFATSSLFIGHFIFGMEIGMVEYAGFCTFIPQKSLATLIATVACFGVPVLVLLTCAIVLYHVVHQQIVQIRAQENATAATPATQSLVSHSRALKTIFCMVAGYYICFTPAMVLQLIWVYLYGYTFSPISDGVTSWFAFSNSMINSLVYLPTIKEYGEIFKRIFIPKMCQPHAEPNQ